MKAASVHGFEFTERSIGASWKMSGTVAERPCVIRWAGGAFGLSTRLVFDGVTHKFSLIQSGVELERVFTDFNDERVRSEPTSMLRNI